ncbi:MAG: MotA/TolQ/ExbB proton channel family protein [Proteobacteria bacterium]|nr:MotA/TolQ/ExbB proton channel family protein [Pseudomonadota bacterium]
MQNANEDLVSTLMSLPIFEAEWVLWLLFALSLISVAVMLERAIFYWRRSIDVHAVRGILTKFIGQGDLNGAIVFLKGFDSMETNVTLFGLRDCYRGPEAVEDLVAGAMSEERQRYERRLGFLATIGNNAPFIGLFGTVLGIIHAFQDLSGNMAEASTIVMAGISEALVATAVGLLVAVPAVIAFNTFKSKVKIRTSHADLLAKWLLAQLKGDDQPKRDEG